ncbi:DUF5812 family protein [Halobacteria archaeon AArc-dxtr1]|nr:DUF5812 family protein [Halobacteria archaeon AArc-dxtr1]
MSEKTATFVVTHAEPDSAVVRDVETAQIHTLSGNPDLEVHDVLEATIAPEPPLEVTWELREEVDRRSVDLVDSDLEPTGQSIELATAADAGEVVREERAGAGEVHAMRLPETDLESAAADVLADEETVARAARLDAVRVEVRRAPETDVLSVRYLPN